jgi:hypothetical protein
MVQFLQFVKPVLPAVFSKLRVLTLNIRTKPSDYLFWMAMFVVAAPLLMKLQTNVRLLLHAFFYNLAQSDSCHLEGMI